MKVVKRMDSWSVEYLGVGARKRRKFFERERDARTWAAQHAAAMTAPATRSRRQMTFGDVLASYYENDLSGTRSASTDAYRVDIIRLSPLGTLAPQAVTPAALSAYCAEREREVSAGTIHNEMRVIRRALAHAEHHLCFKMPKTNAAMSVTLPIRKPRRSRSLAADELARLVYELRCSKFAQSVVEFAVATGMGRSAIFDLRWSDIDEDTATARLAFARVGAERSVALSEGARAILHRQPRRSERCFVGSVEKFRWSWEAALERAGLHDVRFDDLRGRE
jgi:integrase